MKLSKALRQAYDAQDTLTAAISSYKAKLDANPNALSDLQAQTLAQLALALCQVQERIRIHRRVPLPGTARPGNRKVNGNASRVRVEPPAPIPVEVAGPSPVAVSTFPSSDVVEEMDNPPPTEPEPDPTDEPPFEP